MLDVARGLTPGGSCAPLDRLAGQLADVDVTTLAEGERTAFWMRFCTRSAAARAAAP